MTTPSPRMRVDEKRAYYLSRRRERKISASAYVFAGYDPEVMTGFLDREEAAGMKGRYLGAMDFSPADWPDGTLVDHRGRRYVIRGGELCEADPPKS